MKLVAAEEESDALASWLRERSVRITSVVSRIELLRAVHRVAAASGDERLNERAARVITSLGIVGLTDAVAERAAKLEPNGLRTLDSIHLATAIMVGPVDAFVAYDERLIDAARSAGLTVAQPGRKPGR